MHWLLSDRVILQTASRQEASAEDTRATIQHWGNSDDGTVWLLIVAERKFVSEETNLASKNILIKTREKSSAFIELINAGNIELFVRGNVDVQVTLVQVIKENVR
jgi:hypothetical protein